MVKVAQAVERLSRSERANIVRKSALTGMDVIGLDAGDPSFNTPDYICEAAVQAIWGGYHHYPPPNGDAELRAAIAAHLSTMGGGTFSPNDVLVTRGGGGANYAAMVAFLDPGDEVLLLNPSYSAYRDVSLTIGAEVVWVPTAPDLHLDIDALERAVTPRTRMLLINSPGNPTGIVLREDEMRAVADFVRRHDLLLLSDEAYDHLVYDGRRNISAACFEDIADRTVISNTCSKTFAMTGWRVGYLAARNGLLKHPALIHRTAGGGVTYIAQRAALAGFTTKSDWGERMLAEYADRRDTMCSLVQSMPGLHCEKPEGAFYVFVRVQVPMTSEQFVAHCLNHGVLVRSGTEFGPGGEGYVRLTFSGEPANFKPGLERLAKAMHALETGARAG